MLMPVLQRLSYYIEEQAVEVAEAVLNGAKVLRRLAISERHVPARARAHLLPVRRTTRHAQSTLLLRSDSIGVFRIHPYTPQLVRSCVVQAGDGGLKAAAVAEVSVKARIQPGAMHGHTRAFAEGAAAATMTAIKEVGAVAIDSVAGAFGARPPPPGATRSALAVVARGEGKPDALVLFGSRFQKTPAGQPPELAIDARMKVCAHDGR